MRKEITNVKVVNYGSSWDYIEVEFVLGKKRFIDVGGMVIYTENGFLVISSCSNKEKLCKSIKKAKKFVKKEYEKSLGVR